MPKLVLNVYLDFILFKACKFLCMPSHNNVLCDLCNRSCVGRESFKAFQAADLTWLTDTPIVCLNIGQYVNNHNAGNE